MKQILIVLLSLSLVISPGVLAQTPSSAPDSGCETVVLEVSEAAGWSQTTSVNFYHNANSNFEEPPSIVAQDARATATSLELIEPEESATPWFSIEGTFENLEAASEDDLAYNTVSLTAQVPEGTSPGVHMVNLSLNDRLPPNHSCLVVVYVEPSEEMTSIEMTDESSVDAVDNQVDVYLTTTSDFVLPQPILAADDIRLPLTTQAGTHAGVVNGSQTHYYLQTDDNSWQEATEFSIIVFEGLGYEQTLNFSENSLILPAPETEEDPPEEPEETEETEPTTTPAPTENNPPPSTPSGNTSGTPTTSNEEGGPPLMMIVAPLLTIFIIAIVIIIIRRRRGASVTPAPFTPYPSSPQPDLTPPPPAGQITNPLPPITPAPPAPTPTPVPPPPAPGPNLPTISHDNNPQPPAPPPPPPVPPQPPTPGAPPPPPTP